MHLKQTVEGSQFYRFHMNSSTADKVFDEISPTLDNKPIIVLQVAIMEQDIKYNVVIEFIYKSEENK